MEEIGYWVAGAVVGISVLLLVLRSYNGLVYGGFKRLPPGTWGWPLVGETPELFSDFGIGGNPNNFINRRIAKYGKLTSYKSHLFAGPTILLPSVEGIKLVLSSQELFKLGLPNPAQILGTDSFALLLGARRKRFREILMDALAGPEALKNVIPIMDGQTKRLLNEAATKDSFDLFELCKALTQASEMEIFFGPSDQEAFDLYADVFNKFVNGLFGFPVNFPGFARYDAIKGRLKVQKWLQARVDQRRADGKEYTDTMAYLMSTVDETGQKLPDHVITCTMFNFFTGSQSTFRPLFWVLFYLSKNPQFIQELRVARRTFLERYLEGFEQKIDFVHDLQEEHLNMAASKKPGEILTRDDIRKLPFTKKVWDETLRLLNLFPWLFRKANTDVDFHGITIRKGWTALAFLRALHMDPEKFPEPETFNPHRWNDPKTQAAPFLPFGHGQRHCPGMTQAHFQGCLLLYNLTTTYNWEFQDFNSPIRYLPEAKPANCFKKGRQDMTWMPKQSDEYNAAHRQALAKELRSYP